MVIRKTIKSAYDAHGYILDPHGACGFDALKNNLDEDEYGLFFATAHPAKFPEVIEEQIGKTVDIPESMKTFLKGRKKSIKMSDSYEQFRTFLLDLPK